MNPLHVLRLYVRYTTASHNLYVPQGSYALMAVISRSRVLQRLRVTESKCMMVACFFHIDRNMLRITVRCIHAVDILLIFIV